MSRSYKVTGINLKASPLGEQDRLLTILTAERGLIRAVAGGARKGKSSLSGRSNLFVVNQLVIAPGRSLDRITQAETLESFPRFGQDLTRLTAAQYLAEVALLQALDDHPQPDLFDLLQGHLSRLHTAPSQEILPRLIQGLFHLLTLAGLAPQVFHCCRSQQPVVPQFEDPYWRAGFSVTAGGVVALQMGAGEPGHDRGADRPNAAPDAADRGTNAGTEGLVTREPELDEQVNPPDRTPVLPLTAGELHWLQSLAQTDFPLADASSLADSPGLANASGLAPAAVRVTTAVRATTAARPADAASAPPLGMATAAAPPPFMGFPQLRSPGAKSPPPRSLDPRSAEPRSPASYTTPPRSPSPPPTFSDQFSSSSSTVENGPVQQGIPNLPPPGRSLPAGSSAISAWLHLEGILRQYIQYHFDRPLRSAQLIDTCFSSPQPHRSDS